MKLELLHTTDAEPDALSRRMSRHVRMIGGRMNGGIPASRAVLSARISVFDAICCVLAPTMAFLVREQGLATHTSASIVLAYVATSTLVSVLCVALFDLRGIVSRYFALRDAVRIGEASLLSVLFSGMLLFTAFRLETVPRSIPALHALFLAGLLISGRMLARHLRRRKEFGSLPAASNRHTHTMLVGANSLTRAFIDMAREVPNTHEIVVGILASSARLHGRRIAGCPVLGAPDHLETLVDEYETHGVRVDRVVVTDEHFAPGTSGWQQISACAKKFAFDLEYLPDVLVPVFRPDDEPMETDGPRRPEVSRERRLYWAARRFVDVVGAGSLLVFLAPLLAVISAGVLLELGYPAIFWQQRLGRGKRPMKLYKFRTLRARFDREGRQMSGPLMGPVGRFLRATRLDELPQLYNILVGEMSFIGPRPLLPVDQPDSLEQRLSIRPGLTGWAQVQGGRHLTREEKARLDSWYIENASLALDLRILARTVAVVFTGDVVPVSGSNPSAPGGETALNDHDIFASSPNPSLARVSPHV